ncbi:asparagine synthase (glutamine-hydrolyzing), partial [mine drainage metagenome]
TLQGLGAPEPFASLAETLSKPPALEDSGKASERIRQTLRDSVSAHLVADVPVGAFLSGGIDSGALVGLMRDAGAGDIRTVTLGFEEFRGKAEDEVPWAEGVSRLYGTRHTTRIIGREEFLEDWPRIQEAMDQPSVDGANTWLVSKVAHEAGLKVVISGVGGDELFGGYPSFREIPRWVRTMRRIRAIPLAAASGYLLTRLARRMSPAIPPKLPGLFRYGHTMAGAYFVR